MKKRIGLYVATWAVLLAVFNVIAFASVGWAGIEKYTASFWIGYITISVAFVGQFVCTCFALKESNATKLFYRLSLIRTSYTGLIVTFVIGGLCMLISLLPYWVGIIICAITLGCNALAVAKATVAIEEVERIDRKVKTQTIFIKSLTIEAESLYAQATNATIKVECKKVYEAIRYSDPMSSEDLATTEKLLAEKFGNFSIAIKANDEMATLQAATEVLSAIQQRNNKCKLLK